MSGIYAYVVLPSDVEPPPGLDGHGGEPVRRRELDRIWVWYSVASSCPSPVLESIRLHNAVAEAAMQEGVTPLPLRFGQWFAGEEEFARAMEEKASSYRRLLKEVAGCVEFGLRVIEPGDEQPTAVADVSQNESREEPQSGASSAPGTAHLRALARSRRSEGEAREHAHEVADGIGEPFSDVVRRQRIEPLPRGGGLVSIAQLVPRTAIAEYHDRVRDVRRSSRTLRFVVSGPWPPYSFVQ